MADRHRQTDKWYNETGGDRMVRTESKSLKVCGKAVMDCTSVYKKRVREKF